MVKSVMKLGLIDRLRLMVFPLILRHAGKDVPIFDCSVPGKNMAGFKRRGIAMALPRLPPRARTGFGLRVVSWQV